MEGSRVDPSWIDPNAFNAYEPGRNHLPLEVVPDHPCFLRRDAKLIDGMEVNAWIRLADTELFLDKDMFKVTGQLKPVNLLPLCA